MTEAMSFAEQVRAWLLGDGLRMLVTIVLAVVVRWLLLRIIDRTTRSMTSKAASRLAGAGRTGRALASATGLAHERYRQRMETLGSLLRSIVTVVTFGVATLTIMALAGIPLAPLLASAGVGGVALGFGAQSLVKDFLSGVFMILEDQYGVGDEIDTGQVSGTVEDVSLRVTRLVDGDGVVWYVRNGEIVRIGNTSQGWGTATIDMPVSYAEDAEHVIDVIAASLAGLADDPAWSESLLSAPKVMGVESVDGTTMTIRVLAHTPAGQQAPMRRRLRERVKRALDAAGIQGPPAS